MKRVVVVGGGMTGLATMHYLQKLKRKHHLDVELVLIEANDYLGGKIHTVKKAGFSIETGADSIVARHGSVMPLIQDLQLEDEAVYNATGTSYIYTNNELHKIPVDTVFGIPTSKESLFSSTLVSEKGKNEALKDFETKNENFTLESSIGEFLEAFLGKELVEKQIAPVLAGVYSGELHKLTMASTLPYLLEYKNTYGSIIEGLYQNRESFKASAKNRFLSFQGGLSTIIDRLEKTLADVTILTGSKVATIKKQEEQYELTLENGQVMSSDFVVLSTPHQISQGILHNKKLDENFNRLKNTSLISIYMTFDIPDEHLPADGTGFIVSENSDVKCDACTWTSRKWTHTSKDRKLLIRLFYKASNPAYESLKSLSKEEFVEEALLDIEKSLGLKTKPLHVEITNWDEAMPMYHLEHGQAIHSLESQLQEMYPHVFLAGCSYYGVGIGACMKNGEELAEKIANKVVEIEGQPV